MFNKKTKEMVAEMVEISSLTSHNVNILQEALEHLGEAVKNMHELLLVQEARLQLLEDKKEKGNG